MLGKYQGKVRELATLHRQVGHHIPGNFSASGRRGNQDNLGTNSHISP